VVDISRAKYKLCDMDILYADGITSSNALASTEISFPQLSLDVRVVDEPDPQDMMPRLVLSQKAAVIDICSCYRNTHNKNFFCFQIPADQNKQ
jgi:hypothetical protein